MMPTITEKDCMNILTKLFPNSTPNLKHFELKLAPKEQDGFFGDSHTLHLFYNIDNKSKTQIYFVKIYPSIPENAEMANDLLAYEKEIFFYKYLIPEYKKMGIETNFVPECFYFKDEKIIVMEDLTVKNYGMKYRFSLDETKSCLKSIADMHAASILYEEAMYLSDKNFIFEKKYADIFVEKFYDLCNPKSFVYNHFKAGFKCIEKLVDYIPQLKDCKADFLMKLKNHDFNDLFNKDLGLKKVCSHGDLWRRNILFQEITNHCILIDFQMIRYFYPSFDVLSHLYFNFPVKHLKNHREELLNFYYQHLSDCTNSLVDKILPYEDFMKSVNHFEVLTIYQAVVGHTLDITSNVNDTFFGNRAKYCCQEFEANKGYREVLTSDIICLVNYIMKTDFPY